MLRIVPAGESSSIFFMVNLRERGPILTDAAGSDDNVVHPAAVTLGLPPDEQHCHPNRPHRLE